MDQLGVHQGSMDGGLADMRPVYFVLSGKQQDSSFVPFVRISSSNVKSTDLEADPSNGSKSACSKCVRQITNNLYKDITMIKGAGTKRHVKHMNIIEMYQ